MMATKRPNKKEEKLSKTFACIPCNNTCKKRDDLPADRGVSMRSRNGAPSRKWMRDQLPNELGQAPNEYVPPLPPSPHEIPIAFSLEMKDVPAWQFLSSSHGVPADDARVFALSQLRFRRCWETLIHCCCQQTVPGGDGGGWGSCLFAGGAFRNKYQV